MGWDQNIEIIDPEQSIKQLPTIGKHIAHGKDDKIQWRLPRLENKARDFYCSQNNQLIDV